MHFAMQRAVAVWALAAGAAVSLGIGIRSAAAVTIEPLGDSITYGYSTESAVLTPGGYRERLYSDLKNDGIAVDYLGSNPENPGPTQRADGQIMHDGYPKYTIQNIYDNLDGDVQPTGNRQPSNYGGYWLTGTGSRPAIYPEMILLLIGTNDVQAGADAQTIEQRLNELVGKIFYLRPTTHLLVASIPPEPTNATHTAIDQQYNQLIQTQTVPWFSAAGFDITFVDQYANFILPDGTVNAALYGDTLHPNAAGYQLMGDTWAKAVTEALSGGATAVPEPGMAGMIAAGGVVAMMRRRRRADREA